MDFKGKRVLILEGYAKQCLPYLREFKKFGCETTLLCSSKLDCGYSSLTKKNFYNIRELHPTIKMCSTSHRTSWK
jgi:hypothetical protein